MSDAPAARMISIAEPVTDEDELRQVADVLASGWLTQGPKVAEFEHAFAVRHGVAHAVATTSCTTALHLALVALGIGPGDEVIVPSFSWVASANVILYCGATPVFADVDRATFNIDIDSVANCVTSRTRAVIAVHLFGLPVDVIALRECLPAGITVIEDAACAVGASLRGVAAGRLGDIAAFSFHPRKTITTGEGGMVTTDDSDLARRVTVLRNHGASVPEEARHHGPRPYVLPDFAELGYNYRMTDLQGAVGVAQMRKLDTLLAGRRTRAAYYREALSDVEWIRHPSEPPAGEHAWQSYVLYVDESKSPFPRDSIMDRLQAQGIATRPGTHAIHGLDYYRQRYGLHPDALPGARDCAAFSMAIPLHNRMTDADCARVVTALRTLR